MDLKLTRFDSSDEGTFGVLWIPGFPGILFTGELPDRQNQSNISRIPAGKYKGIWCHSPRFKRNMYVLEPVPKRAGIRIHVANWVGDKAKGYKSQVNGCISLGEKLGKLGGQKALLLSGPAIRRFESFMNGRTFNLTIQD
jgi:hypothetical protein